MIDPPPAASAVRVWDLPTRLFHWTLALTMIGSIASAKIGGNAMVWHFRFGYLVFALIAFRLLWGLVGSRHARFSDFIASPAATLAYLKDIVTTHPKRYLGHNPAGGAMVVALLVTLSLASQINS